jgi:DUF218 domain
MSFALPRPLIALVCLAISPSFCLCATVSPSQPIARPLSMHAATQDKNFYLLSLLQQNPQVRAAMEQDPRLRAIAAERARLLAYLLKSCKGDTACSGKGLLWTDEEIGAVSLSLTDLYQNNQPLRQLVDTLRSSGTYVLYQKQSGADLLVSAWNICARGMNDIIAVYGQGAVPRYPLIDSISFDTHSTDGQQRITALLQQASAETSGLFFEPTLKSALALLNMNHRDEAGRLEPMESGVNEDAVKAIPVVHWSRFAYSVIVVPGAGPADLNTALSEEGRRRTELAVEAYRAGKAPFILVSGGYVHPSQTRYAEAIEMKRALLNDYHIPSSAILVDPHARHTTTNMRDAAREIYRYGMPMHKPALVVSDAAQIGYIASQAFADRCSKELGYLPYTLLNQPSATSLAFLPLPESLQQDPIEPLDP